MLPLRDRLPTRLFPFVNYLLIAANIAGFLAQQSAYASGASANDLAMTWGLVPARVWTDPGGTLETVFTSMFMHGDIGHIAGNMLFLWIFGDNVEDAMGHLRYLTFYLLGGVCAATAQVLADPTSTLPMVGASGAIASVLAAYVLLYPRSVITVLNPIPVTMPFLFLVGLFFDFWLFRLLLELPAWLVIGLWFLVNLGDALMTHAQGGVAFMAHVGGFLGGMFLLRSFMAGRVRLDEYARWHRLAPERRARSTW